MSDPEWRWYVSVSKNIGAFNLSVKVYDILNQTRRLTHKVTANYEEDSYRLCMGRYILFGVKWNFGRNTRQQICTFIKQEKGRQNNTKHY